MTSQQEGPTTSYMTQLRRRFSEGIERKSLTSSVRRMGRFSDGVSRSPRGAGDKRVGSFADGIRHRPEARWAHRVGSFSDGLATTGAVSRTVPRIDSARAAGRLAA